MTKIIIATVITVLTTTITVAATRQPATSIEGLNKLTGRERSCVVRCEAKGWPPRCFEQCMKQWR